MKQFICMVFGHEKPPRIVQALEPWICPRCSAVYKANMKRPKIEFFIGFAILMAIGTAVMLVVAKGWWVG